MDHCSGVAESRWVSAAAAVDNAPVQHFSQPLACWSCLLLTLWGILFRFSPPWNVVSTRTTPVYQAHFYTCQPQRQSWNRGLMNTGFHYLFSQQFLLLIYKYMDAKRYTKEWSCPTPRQLQTCMLKERKDESSLYFYIASVEDPAMAFILKHICMFKFFLVNSCSPHHLVILKIWSRKESPLYIGIG